VTNGKITDIVPAIAASVSDVVVDDAEGAIQIDKMRWCRGLPLEQRNSLVFGEAENAYRCAASSSSTSVPRVGDHTVDNHRPDALLLAQLAKKARSARLQPYAVTEPKSDGEPVSDGKRV
jgi:hypothetical protein